MKKLATLLIALVFFGCSKNSEDKPDDPPVVVIEHEIVGKWQYAAFMDDVGPPVWEDVENGNIIEYKKNGYFEVYGNDPDYVICPTQITYVILENQDTSFIEFSCEDEITRSLEFYINEDDELIYPSTFQKDKFVRVNE